MTTFKLAYGTTHLASLIKEAIAETATAHRTGGDLGVRGALPDSFFAPLSEADAGDWGLSCACGLTHTSISGGTPSASGCRRRLDARSVTTAARCM